MVFTRRSILNRLSSGLQSTETKALAREYVYAKNIQGLYHRPSKSQLHPEWRRGQEEIKAPLSRKFTRDWLKLIRRTLLIPRRWRDLQDDMNDDSADSPFELCANVFTSVKTDSLIYPQRSYSYSSSSLSLKRKRLLKNERRGSWLRTSCKVCERCVNRIAGCRGASSEILSGSFGKRLRESCAMRSPETFTIADTRWAELEPP